ncbi:RNA polymerase subunit sigma-70 [Kribbella albertanoniae]|uniref:Sigma-70 family RNA polymerase sigma factor n=1 Tax=Kribbella albertanoniae TaxID=1266829 RepID=A0A4R4Q2F5_9ACTN|nr:RNA polymerase subunit sigma-70 [Kribbella albertanoniae]TDC29167.1 sigma-70 family RNA polymerase sigma factor [Kribbella albertanoniae]
MGFDEEFDALRRGLLAHCYRMLGSHHDAEDVVQEVYLRARKGLAAFEGRSSVKTWLYRIATNASLTALNHGSRRVIPSGLGAPSDDPDTHDVEQLTTPWLEPLPDAALARAGVSDPVHVVLEQESVRLAFVAALQHLAPRQRAVLLLHEVSAWKVQEIAEALEISVPAVKSLLQRARSRLEEVRPAPADPPASAEVERELLDRWIRAFETTDIAAIEKLVHDDFAIEATGHRTWFRGIAVCLPFVERQLLQSPGELRLRATRANGQPAAASYRRDASGHYRATHLVVLTVVGDRIARSTNFPGADHVVAAGLPAVLPG